VKIIYSKTSKNNNYEKLYPIAVNVTMPKERATAHK